MYFDIIFPVFFTVSLGYIYSRLSEPDLETITKLALYVLIPALVFTSLLETQISGREIGQITAFSVILTGSLTVITLLLARWMNLEREEASAFLLTSVFMNTANYGLPVVLLAVGEEGFARAVIFVITQTFLVYSLGVYFAAAGKLDPKRALVAVAKLPTFYAAVLAFVVRALPLELPSALVDQLALLGDAGIVLMLLVLGMQLAQIEVRPAYVQISTASFLRLIISPLLALLLVQWLGMDSVTGQSMVLEAAMPTAVITSLLAMEFDSAPALVSSTILVTTALSFLTITALLHWAL